MPKKFIVAEVSKNWVKGTSRSPETLCEQLERILEVNEARGYRLFKFALTQVMTEPGTMNETIIAVFQKLSATEIALVEALDEFARPEDE